MTAQAFVPLELATIAALLSLLIIPVIWRLAPRLGLVDMPDARKVHSQPVARVGGWGITLGTLVPLLLWLPADPQVQSYIMACLVLFAFGIWDDHRDIGHWSKFSGQLIAAGIVVFHGHLYISRVPFLDALPEPIGTCLTIFAIIGVINAVNHADGLDGLAAGECMLSLIGMLTLGYLAQSSVMVGIAIAMIGGTLGFLRYNSHPARVFMGDAGSQVLGFTLAYLAIYLTQRADTALSAVVPLMLLGVPLIDILTVLSRRIRSGANWFKATRNHLHHQLLDSGLSHFQSVVLIYTAHAAFVVCAVVLRYQTDYTAGAAYALLLLALLGMFSVLRRGHAVMRLGNLPKQEVQHDAAHRVLAWRAARATVAVTATALMLLAAVWVTRVPHDLGIVSACLALALASAMLVARAARQWLVRLSAYLAAIASVYLLINYPGLAAQRAVEVLLVILTLLLTGAVAAAILLATEHRFALTPTDYLIAFVLLVLSIFALIDSNARPMVGSIVMGAVLLYGCEVLLSRPGRAWNGLSISSLATLVILALRGLL
jgi:UDP-GlcNAc:undecaprenyl-phosphate GlcNAc-1-phosphate transferase